MDVSKILRSRQKEWASRHHVLHDTRGYTNSIESNLFMPLPKDVELEFIEGAGDELRRKIRALHSSSALVYNFFQYWRINNVSLIASACGSGQGMVSLRYEQQYLTGLSRPHLDVEFLGPNLKPLFIESKFTETYGRKKAKFADSYFGRNRLWEHLPKCLEIANLIRANPEIFSYFDAAQLIKHTLGLTNKFGRKGFKLLYLWYECESPETLVHNREVEEFIKRLEC